MTWRGKQKLVFGIALVLLANVVTGLLLFQGRLYGQQTYVDDMGCCATAPNSWTTALSSSPSTTPA